MKEAIEALFGNKGVATPEHVETLKSLRSLDDVTTEGIDADAMDRLGFFLDAPSETAQSETDEDRRSLLLVLAGHVMPKTGDEKKEKKEEKPAARPTLGGGDKDEEKPSGKARDPRKDLLASFDKADVEEQEEDDADGEEDEVTDERPRGERRGGRDRERRPRYGRDREDEREDRETRRNRRDRDKKDPQPPRPGIVIGKVEHLRVRVFADPLWAELRDHIFGEIRTMRSEPPRASIIRWQLTQLSEALNYGPAMAERFPYNVRLLAVMMIRELLLNQDIGETRDQFISSYSEVP